MNKGDSLICHTEFKKTNCKFIKDEVYEVGYIDEINKTIGVVIDKTIPFKDKSAMVFNLNDGNFCYKNYFITLAEWRDKQIDSILEDE